MSNGGEVREVELQLEEVGLQEQEFRRARDDKNGEVIERDDSETGGRSRI